MPDDFKDFFVNSDVYAQQEIVSSLLVISTECSSLTKPREDKVVTCPDCQDVRIRVNGKLKGVQRYLYNGCGKNFSHTAGKFWCNIKKKDKITDYLLCLLSDTAFVKAP